MAQIMADTMPSVPLLLNYHQTVTSPSILHLAQILQAEMHSPQAMSQMFISSVVTVLITHLLQHWQSEQQQQ